MRESTFGVVDVAHATGQVNSIEEAALEFGRSGDFLDRRIGTRSLPRLSEDQKASDLAQEAVENLLLRNPDVSVDDIDTLMVVTQNGDHSGLPHTSAILQAALGMRTSTFCADVGLGCSGYVHALKLVQGLHAVGQTQNALLVTADPYSRILDPADYSTQLLFGDAATASLLSSNSEWTVGNGTFFTDGTRGSSISMESGALHMDGKAILGFAKRDVTRLIRQAMADQGLRMEDVDLFLIHQGSRVVVETVAQEFPDVRDRFPLHIDQLGNTVSSTIPLLLEKYISDRSIRHLLLVGFGVGLSAGVITLDRRALGEEKRVG